MTAYDGDGRWLGLVLVAGMLAVFAFFLVAILR
jgi:hypothetical protein